MFLSFVSEMAEVVSELPKLECCFLMGALVLCGGRSKPPLRTEWSWHVVGFAEPVGIVKPWRSHGLVRVLKLLEQQVANTLA